VKSTEVSVKENHVRGLCQLSLEKGYYGKRQLGRLSYTRVCHSKGKDMLSISKLTYDFPLIFEFDGNGFLIKDMFGNGFLIKDMFINRVVANESKRGGLYALDRDPASFFSHCF
jgi:hypothetical protein